MNPIIRYDHVDISYHGKQVVHDVSFGLKAGEILGSCRRKRQRKINAAEGGHGTFGQRWTRHPRRYLVPGQKPA